MASYPISCALRICSQKSPLSGTGVVGLLAEDRAREEAQAAEAAAKVAVAQAEAGVLAEDADAAEAVEADSVEE